MEEKQVAILLDFLEDLLARKVDVNAKDYRGSTALLLAINVSAWKRILPILIKYGVDLNYPDMGKHFNSLTT